MNTLNQSQSNLQQLLDIMREVVILSFYKSFPVTSKGHYQGVRGNTIIFKVTPPESVCFAQSKQAWILGGELFEALKVNISSFNIQTGILELAEPTYAGFKFGNRKVARVEPKEKIPVAIHLEESNQTAQGIIADISLGGAGILLNEGESINLTAGEPLTMRIKFPQAITDQPVEIKGKIITRSRPAAKADMAGGVQQIRFSAVFTTSMVSKTPILLYIARRRAELMKEVQQLYTEMLQKAQSG